MISELSNFGLREVSDSEQDPEVVILLVHDVDVLTVVVDCFGALLELENLLWILLVGRRSDVDYDLKHIFLLEHDSTICPLVDLLHNLSGN